MRAGEELVWSDCMLRKIWLEDMVRVSFDSLEKVVVSSTRLFSFSNFSFCIRIVRRSWWCFTLLRRRNLDFLI